MNDRFKFRIYDKAIGEMSYDVCIGIIKDPFDDDIVIADTSCGQIEYRGKRLNDIILMQSTGLKDKNGKLIYEGDIVIEHYYNTKETAIKKVFFDEKVIGFAYTDGIEYNQLSITDGNRLQVIGNIYGNKECE